jgi:hypothetical protein
MFSWNLFMDSPPGLALGVAALVVTLVLSVKGYLAVSRALGLNRRAGLVRRLEPVLFIGCVVAPGVALLSLSSRLLLGRVTGLTVMGEGDSRIVRASFEWIGGARSGTRHSQDVTFAIDGTVLGRQRTSSTVFQEGERTLGTQGGLELVARGEHLALRDAVSLEPVHDLSGALDERFGAGQYRYVGFRGSSVRVELVDGREEALDLGAFMAGRTAGPGQRRALLGDTSCAAAADTSSSRGANREGSLLRARRVSRGHRSSQPVPCSFSLPSPSQLVLHRSTAFGDGAHLLSAVPESGDAPRWTVDLSPLLAWLPESGAVQVLEPEVRGTEVCFFLLRVRRSLAEVCVNAADGSGLRHQLVF